jgi:hypothetical protein
MMRAQDERVVDLSVFGFVGIFKFFGVGARDGHL